ncbi:MAG: hypothetical protein D6681_18420 [Calditrichaeota bacterium]|nr:MAG: hypothetical protein D6681_18420 [Calditrichota bacterium]
MITFKEIQRDMDVRDLIQAVDENFRLYHQLLSKIYERPVGEDRQADMLNELLRTIAVIQDEVVDFRLKKILQEEHPYLPQISIDKIRMNRDIQRIPLPQIVDHFLRQRQGLVKLLSSLSGDTWERTGVHEVEGHVSFKEFVRRLVEKDKEVLHKLSALMNTLHLS